MTNRVSIKQAAVQMGVTVEDLKELRAKGCDGFTTQNRCSVDRIKAWVAARSGKRPVQSSEPGAIVIEKGIPLPVARGVTTRWPFAAMTPGDSFRIPDDAKVATVRSAAYSHGKAKGWTMAVRAHGGGMRVWRLK